MRLSLITFLGATVVLASAAVAQHAGHGQHAGHAQHTSAYADIAVRPIKALSDDQIGDLKAGRGMGLSLPAELNGYPGPRHVMELADQLDLNAAQRQTTSQLINAMSAEAVALGTEIIGQEVLLEKLFADRNASADQTRAVVDRIGTAQASLRFVHLKYLLAMRTAMTAEQIEKYAGLRSYTPTKQ